MEEHVFRAPAVAGKLRQGFVEARLHTDGVNDPVYDGIRRLQLELTGSKATPIYLVIDPRTGERIHLFEGADLAGSRFELFLDEALGRASKVLRGPGLDPSTVR